LISKGAGNKSDIYLQLLRSVETTVTEKQREKVMFKPITALNFKRRKYTISKVKDDDM
jgi:hypothetical protein